MSKEIVTIADSRRLVDFTDENDMLFHLTQNEATLLFKYVHSTNHNTYRALGEREGQLFMKKGTMHEDEISGEKIFHDAEWVSVTMDEVVDEICEMNYELRSEILERLEESEVDFMDRSVYESLMKDCKQLDAMFARTEFSKKLDELAERTAEEAIQSYLERQERKEVSGKEETEQKSEENSLRQGAAKEEVPQQHSFFAGRGR